MMTRFPDPVAEPTSRRIRVRLGGQVVADSTSALLLLQYPPAGLPTYFLPRADIRDGALTGQSAGPGGQRRWTVQAGGERAGDAAWTHPDSTGPLAALADHVTFSWQQLEWYEEDERVIMHARDPYKRVDTLRSSRRVQVYAAGQMVANSARPLLLFETHLPTRYYLPFSDVRTDLLRASDTVTVCPYKGRARYWSLAISDTIIHDVAWSYPDPIPENPKIRDLLCFFNERVNLIIDGQPLSPPVTPWSS